MSEQEGIPKSALIVTGSMLNTYRAKDYELEVSELETQSKDEALEEKIKEGSTGMELVFWTSKIYGCTNEEALIHIKRITSLSYEMFSKNFRKEQIIVMAFGLYQRAISMNRIKDALNILIQISKFFFDEDEQDENNKERMNRLKMKEMQKEHENRLKIEENKIKFSKEREFLKEEINRLKKAKILSVKIEENLDSK